MTAALQALAERLEKATGPNDDLARDLWEALTGECVHRNTHYVELENDERELECSDCGADTYGSNKWRGILSSLDAAIALCERLFPDGGWRVDASARRDCWATAGHLSAQEGATHRTSALALVLAVVRARIAEGTE